MRKGEIVFLTLIAALIIGGFGGNYLWKNYQYQKQLEIDAANKEYSILIRVYRNFGLDLDIVTAKNGTNQIVNISEGEYTDIRINNYNTWVDYRIQQAELDPKNESLQNQLAKIMSVNESTGGKITLQNVYDSPKTVAAMWNGGPMTMIEESEIFAKETIEIHMTSWGGPLLMPKRSRE